MVIFTEFPSGNALWMVKDVDRFRLPHAMTESASVDVLLQQIDSDVERRAYRASPGEIAKLMAIPRERQCTFHVARIHAASLPAIRVGQLYRERTYCAELPTETLTLNLPNAERSLTELRLDQDLPPPEGWDAKRRHAVLVSSEFYVEQAWRAQRVLHGRTTDGRDVIIPRTCIFQRFYGPHSEMADALTSGPWDKVRARLIYDGVLENGLRTRKATERNEWHLVLETLIPNEFRLLVALYAFDEYAQTQVRRLYSDALAQRRGNDHLWFCTASLPFNPQHPLGLKVKGYGLAKTPSRPDGAFFVTSILAATVPPNLPLLAWSRLNSGEQAETVIMVDQPKPYTGTGSREHDVRNLPHIGSLYAPPTNAAVSQHQADTFEWLGTLNERPLLKNTSKRYRDAKRSPSEPEAGPDPHSTAKPVAGGRAGSRILTSTHVRPRIDHFENLIECLGNLAKAGKIEASHIVQPGDPVLRAERGGRIVWSLTEAAALAKDRKSGKQPWLFTSGRKAKGIPRTGRTVLVVEVDHAEHRTLLFEVECRPAETGFVLAALTSKNGAPADIQLACERMMNAIVRSEGRHLAKAATQVAKDVGEFESSAFKHQYATDYGKRHLDPEALMRFLTRCRGKKQGSKRGKKSTVTVTSDPGIAIDV